VCIILSRQTDELHVRKIREGTVIDHIPAGRALEVLKILNVTGRGDKPVSLVMNVPSKKMGKKDIVKLEERELSIEEIDKISLIAPNASINIIRNYDVFRKENVKLPSILKSVLVCANRSCITNSEREPVKSTFFVESETPPRLRCYYCQRLMEEQDLLRQL